MPGRRGVFGICLTSFLAGNETADCTRAQSETHNAYILTMSSVYFIRADSKGLKYLVFFYLYYVPYQLNIFYTFQSNITITILDIIHRPVTYLKPISTL
jgi:hypothetical protein